MIHENILIIKTPEGGLEVKLTCRVGGRDIEEQIRNMAVTGNTVLARIMASDLKGQTGKGWMVIANLVSHNILLPDSLGSSLEAMLTLVANRAMEIGRTEGKGLLAKK